MIDPLTAASVVKGAYDLAKRGITIADKLGDLELKEIILSLKQTILDKDEKIFLLKEEMAELSQKQKLKEDLVFDRNVWWLKDNDEKTGPYCPSCYGDKEKLVRLADKTGGSGSQYWECPVCTHKEFYNPGAPIVRRSSRGRY